MLLSLVLYISWQSVEYELKVSSNILLSGVLQVLDVEFHNVKALYRRAQAYMETADLDLAELDIKNALEADPQNR